MQQRTVLYEGGAFSVFVSPSGAVEAFPGRLTKWKCHFLALNLFWSMGISRLTMFFFPMQSCGHDLDNPSRFVDSLHEGHHSLQARPNGLYIGGEDSLLLIQRCKLFSFSFLSPPSLYFLPFFLYVLIYFSKFHFVIFFFFSSFFFQFYPSFRSYFFLFLPSLVSPFLPYMCIA